MSDQTTIIVIFGVTGDLARRKLIPSLYRNFIKRRLPRALRIVGVGRREWTDSTLIDHAQQSLREFAASHYDDDAWSHFKCCLSYSKVNLPLQETYQNLKDHLDALDNGSSNRLYYLSIAPEFYETVVWNLGRLDMARERGGWRRIVIEKPFGYDLKTAHSLNEVVHSVFDESQVYRIDHYLGKETAQNILFMRFANTIFEPIWNRSHISNVQVTVAETVDVGTRAGYYDKSGVVRDMMQNHLLQLLSLIAMEPPSAFDGHALRNEKVKVLQASRPLRLCDTVRAQYDGYRHADGVSRIPARQLSPPYVSSLITGAGKIFPSTCVLAKRCNPKPPRSTFSSSDRQTASSSWLKVAIHRAICSRSASSRTKACT